MKDFQKKTVDELRKFVNDQREALRSFRFSEAGSRTRNVKEGKALKVSVARALTAIRQKELAQEAETA